jgi:CRISPR system Cascade subunit CasE
MTATLDRTTAITTTTLTLVPLTHPSLASVRSWTDQESVHKAVMSLFPATLPATLPGDDGQRRATGTILHSHDIPDHRPARLLVQHATPMRPEHSDNFQHADLAPLLANLRPGQPVRFRIILNAVRSKARSNTRMPITDPDDLVDWGLERLRGNGLEQIELSDQPRTLLMSATNVLWTAQYDGNALISDPGLTRHALLHGIGRSRAYGCGLLSLAPPRS